eukprot:m.202525 g.202525  ORF g.202525 m.202525 type:complete len:93 (-) comp25247_c0_seq1:1494-1772(-)
MRSGTALPGRYYPNPMSLVSWVVALDTAVDGAQFVVGSSSAWGTIMVMEVAVQGAWQSCVTALRCPGSWASFSFVAEQAPLMVRVEDTPGAT